MEIKKTGHTETGKSRKDHDTSAKRKNQARVPLEKQYVRPKEVRLTKKNW